MNAVNPRGLKLPRAEHMVVDELWLECRTCHTRFSWDYKACPLCTALGQVKELQGREVALRAKVMEMRNQVERAQEGASRLRVQVDLVAAMKQALDICNDQDLALLKAVAYRAQADPGSAELRVVHGKASGRGRGRRAPATGFLLILKDVSEPEAWEASSIGGVALAGYYEEALKLEGNRKAMAMLIRALAPMLATPAPPVGTRNGSVPGHSAGPGGQQ